MPDCVAPTQAITLTWSGCDESLRIPKEMENPVSGGSKRKEKAPSLETPKQRVYGILYARAKGRSRNVSMHLHSMVVNSPAAVYWFK